MAPEQSTSGQELKAEDLAAAVLSQILSGGKSSDGTASEPALKIVAAEIYAVQKISNAFALSTQISGGLDSACEVGVYRGKALGIGYRLVMVSGAPLQLLRLTSRGSMVVQSSEKPITLGDGKARKLLWTRSKGGVMKVQIDGKPVLTATDRRFKGPFAGVVHANRAGDCLLRSITIDGTS